MALVKTDEVDKVTYTDEHHTIVIKKDEDYLDVHQITSMASGEAQSWQDIVNYLDTKL